MPPAAHAASSSCRQQLNNYSSNYKYNYFAYAFLKSARRLRTVFCVERPRPVRHTNLRCSFAHGPVLPSAGIAGNSNGATCRDATQNCTREATQNCFSDVERLAPRSMDQPAVLIRVWPGPAFRGNGGQLKRGDLPRCDSKLYARGDSELFFFGCGKARTPFDGPTRGAYSRMARSCLPRERWATGSQEFMERSKGARTAAASTPLRPRVRL
jgi:hypothetical protein